jgi:hypothetical protein
VGSFRGDEFYAHLRRMERRLCIARIRRWTGLTEDEKRIAIDALNGEFDRRRKWNRRLVKPNV